MKLPNGKRAILTIIADDADYKSGQLLLDLALALDIRISIGGVVKVVLPHLSFWQENEKWLEMLNHSWSHAPASEDSGQEFFQREYLDAKCFFEAHFKSPQFCFIPPFNYIPATGYELLEANGVLAARQWRPELNSLKPAKGRGHGQWLNLNAYGIGDVNSCAERDAWIDQAIEQEGWLIEMWHNVYLHEPYGYQPLMLEDAFTHLRYAKMREQIWIASFSEAVSWLYGP